MKARIKSIDPAYASKWAIGAWENQEVFHVTRMNPHSNTSFYIGHLLCRIKDCAHLGGGDWHLDEDEIHLTK